MEGSARRLGAGGGCREPPSPSPTGQLLSSRVTERLASGLHHHAPGWATRAERGRGWAPAAWAPQISLWCFAPAQARRFPQAEPSPATPTPPCRAPSAALAASCSFSQALAPGILQRFQTREASKCFILSSGTEISVQAAAEQRQPSLIWAKKVY